MAKLGNSWTKFVQNFANTDFIVGGINALTSLLNVVDELVDTFGAFPMLMAGLGLFQGAKGGGRRRKSGTHFVYATEEFNGNVYELCVA